MKVFGAPVRKVQTRFNVYTAFAKDIGAYIVLKAAVTNKPCKVRLLMQNAINRYKSGSSAWVLSDNNLIIQKEVSGLMSYDAKMEHDKQIRDLYAFGKPVLNPKP